MTSAGQFGMYGPPHCRKRKMKVTGWSAQMYTDPGCSLAKAADHPLTNPPGTKAGSTNDWMGIIGEIRRCAACELGDEVAKSRWPRTQPVNRVLPLTLTFQRDLVRAAEHF